MKQHSQTVFYIEQLQVYNLLGVRLPGMLVGALVGLAISAFLLFPNLSIGIISIVLGGLLGELLSGSGAVQRFAISNGKARSVLWLRVLQWLGIGVLIALIVALSVWLNTPLQSKSDSFLNFGLITYGLSFGLWNMLLHLLLEKFWKPICS